MAVYLFGSSLERPEQARDVDLAVLVRPPGKGLVNLYLALYPRLAEIFTPLEVDLLFLNSASLPVCFEAIKTEAVVYCADEVTRTDFEDFISGQYMDFRYHLETARRELFEAVKEGSPLV